MSVATLAFVLLAAPPIRVGVLPVSGSAPIDTRRAAEEVLTTAIDRLDGLEPVAFSALGAVFSPSAQAALQSCRDDPCLAREAVKLIAVQQIVVAVVDREDGLRIRLRRVDPARPEVPVARVTQRTDAASLNSAVATATAELFPEAARRSLGILVVTGAREGAQVRVDGVDQARMAGTMVSSAPQATLRLPPGGHRIEVTYPGHMPFETDVEVVIGPPTTLEVELDKNRSIGPWLLGGGGIVLAGTAGLVGLTAQNTANDWSDACTDGACQPGFTRRRYEQDRNQVNNGRNVANGLLITGGVAVVGALLWYLLDPGSDPEPTAEAGP